MSRKVGGKGKKLGKYIIYLWIVLFSSSFIPFLPIISSIFTFLIFVYLVEKGERCAIKVGTFNQKTY